MPTKTFYNLPVKKRKLIEKVSMEEFAAHDYESVSISKIVRQAGIAKGSFYQYFSDKKDLLFHIMELGVTEKKAYIAKALEELQKNNQAKDGNEVPHEISPHITLFQILRAMYKGGISFAQSSPLQAAIGFKVFSSITLRNEMMQNFKDVQLDFFKPLIAQAREAGEVSSEISDEFLIFLFTQMNFAVVEYAMDSLKKNDYEQIEGLGDIIIDIFERGIGPVKKGK